MAETESKIRPMEELTTFDHKYSRLAEATLRRSVLFSTYERRLDDQEQMEKELESILNGEPEEEVA